MEVVDAARKALGDAGKHFEALVLGPIWGYIHAFHLSDNFWASPYVWVSVFWVLNWVLGTILAIRDREWTPRDSFRSVIKLIVWLTALGLASGLKKSGVTGGFIPAGVLEFGVVITEFVYALRNLGRFSAMFGNQNQAEVLTFVADKADEFAGHRTNTRTTVTVTETQVTQPIENKKDPGV